LEEGAGVEGQEKIILGHYSPGEAKGHKRGDGVRREETE